MSLVDSAAAFSVRHADGTPMCDAAMVEQTVIRPEQVVVLPPSMGWEFDDRGRRGFDGRMAGPERAAEIEARLRTELDVSQGASIDLPVGLIFLTFLWLFIAWCGISFTLDRAGFFHLWPFNQ